MTVGNQWQDPAFGINDPNQMGFFSATGEPLSMASLPQGLGEIHWYQCAFDGTLSYIVSHGSIYAFDKTGKALWSFKSPHEPWSISVSKGDLAVFYGKTIEWYSTAVN